MGKQVISTADVQNIDVGGELLVSEGAIVTPLAYDLAAERKVSIVTQVTRNSTSFDTAAKWEGSSIKVDESLVRAIVQRVLLGNGAGESSVTTARSPVKLARIAEAKLEKFGYPGPPEGMQVQAVDVITQDDGSPIAAGYMTLTKGSFPWTLTYDEVQIVLEGELQLGGDGGDRTGRAGDIFFVPKGSKITFGTPSWAKFIYVTFPANWEEGIK